eukprot:232323-Rhodomonas_salina.9
MTTATTLLEKAPWPSPGRRAPPSSASSAALQRCPASTTAVASLLAAPRPLSARRHPRSQRRQLSATAGRHPARRALAAARRVRSASVGSRTPSATAGAAACAGSTLPSSL